MQACYLKAFSARVPQLIGRDSAALSPALLRQTTRVFHLLLIVCVCKLDHFDSVLFVVAPLCISLLIHLFHSWWIRHLRSTLRQFLKISNQQLLNSSKLTEFTDHWDRPRTSSVHFIEGTDWTLTLEYMYSIVGENAAPGQNPTRHRENMQTHSKALPTWELNCGPSCYRVTALIVATIVNWWE